MPGSDGGFRHSEPYVEMADAPLWRAEADAQVHRLLATPLSPRGRWERVSTELVYRARATPLWSAGAAAVPPEERMLDRVVDFRIVVRLLLGHPTDAPAILDHLGVGCVVSAAEAQQLGAIRPDAGWEAYESAGIRVVDAESGTPFDVAAGARRQRDLLARLRTPAATPLRGPTTWPPPDPNLRDGGDPTPAGGSPLPPVSSGQPATTAVSPPQAAQIVPPQATQLPTYEVLETFVPVLRQLVGETARVTYGSNWIAATVENEYLKVTFGRPAPGTAVVSANMRSSRGHEDQVEEVVRHVSPDELLSATIAALVRVHDAARVASDTRLREVEATQMRASRVIVDSGAAQEAQQGSPAQTPPPPPPQGPQQRAASPEVPA